MVKANRTSWEREAYLDELYGRGSTAIPRHKFVLLGDHNNLCNAVYDAWREHWKEYCDDQRQELEMVLAGGTVFVWRKGQAEVKPRVL